MFVYIHDVFVQQFVTLGSEQEVSDPAASIDNLSMRWCPAKRSGAWKSTHGALSFRGASHRRTLFHCSRCSA